MFKGVLIFCTIFFKECVEETQDTLAMFLVEEGGLTFDTSLLLTMECAEICLSKQADGNTKRRGSRPTYKTKTTSVRNLIRNDVR